MAKKTAENPSNQHEDVESFSPAIVEHTPAILGEAGLFNQLQEKDIYVAKLHQSGGKAKTTKYGALGVHLPERNPPRSTFAHSNTSRVGTFTYLHMGEFHNQYSRAAHILAEQLVRPSNWTYDRDAPPTDFPSYGFWIWSVTKRMNIAGNNCYKGKINCLQWLISGSIRSDDDRTTMESGGNWDLQIGRANHGIAYNKKITNTGPSIATTQTSKPCSNYKKPSTCNATHFIEHHHQLTTTMTRRKTQTIPHDLILLHWKLALP